MWPVLAWLAYTYIVFPSRIVDRSFVEQKSCVRLAAWTSLPHGKGQSIHPMTSEDVNTEHSLTPQQTHTGTRMNGKTRKPCEEDLPLSVSQSDVRRSFKQERSSSVLGRAAWMDGQTEFSLLNVHIRICFQLRPNRLRSATATTPSSWAPSDRTTKELPCHSSAWFMEVSFEAYERMYIVDFRP